MVCWIQTHLVTPRHDDTSSLKRLAIRDDLLSAFHHPFEPLDHTGAALCDILLGQALPEWYLSSQVGDTIPDLHGTVPLVGSIGLGEVEPRAREQVV